MGEWHLVRAIGGGWWTWKKNVVEGVAEWSGVIVGWNCLGGERHRAQPCQPTRHAIQACLFTGTVTVRWVRGYGTVGPWPMAHAPGSAQTHEHAHRSAVGCWAKPVRPFSVARDSPRLASPCLASSGRCLLAPIPPSRPTTPSPFPLNISLSLSLRSIPLPPTFSHLFLFTLRNPTTLHVSTLLNLS